jgi:hypothetical protein
MRPGLTVFITAAIIAPILTIITTTTIMDLGTTLIALAYP